MTDKKEVTVGIGDHIVTVLVGESDTSAEEAKAIVEAINKDPDCPAVVFIDENGTICREKILETMELRIMPDITLENFKTSYGLAGKKGRRRGQRVRDFPRR